jgi:lysyl-tRNA synthetase class 2
VAEQRERLEHQMAEKERIYGERYPIDEDFLNALAAMPQACGIALGFDRLVMLATGAARIDEVMWTPISET